MAFNCGLLQLIESHMIDTVKITSAKCQRSNPIRQRFSRDDGNMWRVAFTIANQIKAFRARVLGSIAANRPFARDAGMQKQL